MWKKRLEINTDTYAAEQEKLLTASKMKFGADIEVRSLTDT